MSKKIKLVSLFILILTFLSCGGSDITPPSDVPQPENPEINPPSDITQMIGKAVGICQISLYPSINKSNAEVGEVLVAENGKDKAKLFFSFNRPEVSAGITEGSSFKKTDGSYSFALGSYKAMKTSFEGENIPTYIKEWFADMMVLTKVELGELICEKGGVYDVERKTFSMKYTCTLVLHYVGGEKPLTGYSLEFEYSNLIKKD